MKGFKKRFGVGVVAASLVMSSSMVAFAADTKTGTSTGAGAIEGVVETDVFKADLPTENTSVYAYIADPQGLIRKTNAAKYSGKTFGEGNVFFQNADGNYSNTSDPAKIVNKSSTPLAITVKAKATAGTDNGDGVASLATSKTFDDSDTNLGVYLGLIDSVDANTEKALTATDATEGTDAIMKAVLGAAPEDAYEYSYNSNEQKYTYAIKSDVSGYKFAEYSFQITGVANDKADWKAGTVLPEVSVTWDVDLAAAGDTVTVETPAQVSAPSAPATATYSKANGAEINVDLGVGNLAATNATVQVKITADGDLRTPSGIAYADGKITVQPNMWMAASTGDKRWLVVTFNDSATTTKTIELTMAE